MTPDPSGRTPQGRGYSQVVWRPMRSLTSHWKGDGVIRRFLPFIAVVWGAAILAFGIIKGISGSGSYGAGQITALLFGVALVLAGIRELKKRSAATY